METTRDRPSLYTELLHCVRVSLGRNREMEPETTNLIERLLAATRQRCGLCGHTRIWHHAHLMAWGD